MILVRDETTPDDFHGMVEAQGILTARGGKTSHAAIVAVGMGKPAVCGVTDDPLPGGRHHRDRRAGLLARATASRSTAPTGTVFEGDAPLLPPDPEQPLPAADHRAGPTAPAP